MSSPYTPPAAPVADPRRTPPVDPALITWTHFIYALHATSIVIGVFSAAFIVTAFVSGLPSIIAVVLNYVKRSDVRGTYLDSHFRWQIRTFWFALAWAVLVAAVSIPLTLILIGFATWAVGMFALGVWAIYRIARGWLRLNDRQGMPLA